MARYSPPSAQLAQLVEHFHGKEGVAGSSPALGLKSLQSTDFGTLGALRRHLGWAEVLHLSPPRTSNCPANGLFSRATTRYAGRISAITSIDVRVRRAGQAA